MGKLEFCQRALAKALLIFNELARERERELLTSPYAKANDSLQKFPIVGPIDGETSDNWPV